MSKSTEQLEAEWDKMTLDEKCLAYGRAVLAAARKRDSIFKTEKNVSNEMYEMRTTYIYGGGER